MATVETHLAALEREIGQTKTRLASQECILSDSRQAVNMARESGLGRLLSPALARVKRQEGVVRTTRDLLDELESFHAKSLGELNAKQVDLVDVVSDPPAIASEDREPRKRRP